MPASCRRIFPPADAFCGGLPAAPGDCPRGCPRDCLLPRSFIVGFICAPPPVSTVAAADLANAPEMRHGCVHYLRRCCINGQQQHARYWLRAGGVDKDRRLCFRQSRSLLTWAVQLDAQAQNLDGEYAQAAPKPAFKAAIDFRAIRDNFDQVVQNVRNRNSAANPKKVLQLYDEWRELEDETGRVRSERNDNAKSMKVGQAVLIICKPQHACPARVRVKATDI